MAAVTFAELTNVVVRLDPFQSTTAPRTKPVPFTVSVKAGPPRVLLFGVSEVSVGTGLLMLKVAAFDVPPPGVGLNTVTCAVPPVAISAAVMAAVTWAPLTKVVVRLKPFHCTTEAPTKFEPFTVSVKADPPARALGGESVVIPGTGLFTENVAGFDVLPVEELNTVTCGVPAFAISLAGTVAVTCELLTKVVVRATPFHCTTDVASNCTPFTVRVNPAPPALALEGESEVTERIGSNVAKLMSQMLRPCVEARSVREGLCSASPSTATLGRPSTNEVQVVPPSMV